MRRLILCFELFQSQSLVKDPQNFFSLGPIMKIDRKEGENATLGQNGSRIQLLSKQHKLLMRNWETIVMPLCVC